MNVSINYTVSSFLFITFSPSSSVNGILRHLHTTMLQCWAKFSNFLRMLMVHVKNDETMSKFVTTMHTIL